MSANRLWLAAGAIAVAAASVFPPVLAQADNGTDGVNSAGTPNPAQASRGGVSRSQAAANASGADAGNPAAPGRSANAKATVSAQANTGSNPLLQNPLWWFGTPNPTPPSPAIPPSVFQPLANLPGWSQQYYGWYRNMNFEACVLGLSSTVAPYGTATNSVSTSGC